MDGRPTWTDCDEAGDYVVPNVLSPRDLVFRPDNMDETVPQTQLRHDDSRLRAQQKQCVETSDARQRHRTLEQKKTNSSTPVG